MHLRDLGVAQVLEEAEVQERDSAVGQEQRVAGVRIAVEQAVAQRAVEIEAHEDLAEAVALRRAGSSRICAKRAPST